MIKRFFSAATFAMFMFGTASAADLGGKVLKVGSDTTYPPMETVDPATGQIVGFDVEVSGQFTEIREEQFNELSNRGGSKRRKLSKRRKILKRRKIMII